MKKYLLSFFIVVALVMPLVSLAQTSGVNVSYSGGSQSTSGCQIEITSIAKIFDLAICILRFSVWPLLISISVIVFIVGVIKYISNGDDSAKREEGRNFIMYGLIGLFVIVSVWGLVGVLQGTFGLGNTPFIPQLQEPN